MPGQHAFVTDVTPICVVRNTIQPFQFFILFFASFEWESWSFKLVQASLQYTYYSSDHGTVCDCRVTPYRDGRYTRYSFAQNNAFSLNNSCRYGNVGRTPN